MVGRITVIVAAIVVCAWFGLTAHETHRVNLATAIVQNGGVKLTNVQAAHVRSLLSGASFANPDRTPQLLRGESLTESGHRRQALTVLLPVTRAEPDNVNAWAAVAGAATVGSKLLTHSVAEVGRLDPTPKQRSAG